MPFIPDTENKITKVSGFIPDENTSQANVNPSLLGRLSNTKTGVENTLGNFGAGIIKGLSSSAVGLGQLGLRGASLLPLSQGMRQSIQQGIQTGEELKLNELRPEGTAQNIGFGGEQIAEFFIPGGQEAKAIKIAEKGIDALKYSPILKSFLKLGSRMGISGTSAGAVGTIQAGDTEGGITPGIIGGLVPAGGQLLKSTKQPIGKFLTKTGEIIENKLIKPLKADIEDGFKVANITKYNLGGSLNQMLEKTQSKLSELTQQLNQKLTQPIIVNLNNVYQKTSKDLLGEKPRLFGNIRATKRQLDQLKDELFSVSKNGRVDLPSAQDIKQAAGQRGAWVYGYKDPDATALEKVYTKFYQNLKTEIEKVAPAGVKEINKQISELIPISHAIIRRIPVEQRNNLISLNDMIAAGISIAEPRALSLFILNRLSKSGEFGNLLIKQGKRLLKTPSERGIIGTKLFGGQ